jgi:asparagine synthase (glutamine-hydrolysing)
MCGIVAEYGKADPQELEAMLARLEHRGPDEAGTVDLGEAWLGHTRLSIVDLGGGAQPLGPAPGGLQLVGNGEVYNHEAIRAKLAGAPFETDSDNEVALHVLERDEPEALERLEGMFAFCAADGDGRFVAARDAVGIKPLYWTPPGRTPSGTVRFASEMRAFADEWLPFVEPFPPGHVWSPQGGLRPFARAVRDEVRTPAPAAGADRAAIVRSIAEGLEASVRRQMMGDVRVGVFLSGGLDSSIIAALAAKVAAQRGERLPTFAVGTPGSADVLAARAVAEHLGTDHHETSYGAEEALAAVPEVVRSIESFDPSLVRSAVPNFFLAREAARHVKVVLTGEGADELFAGYAYLRGLDDEALHAELVRTVEGLHHVNLQRCDRVTMAHGLEARVPFLDRAFIDLALRIPPALKQPGDGAPEKALLREAFAGTLPEAILWRDKAEFGDGSGARDVLADAIDGLVSDEELEAERHELDPPLRSKQELWCWRILRDHLPGLRAEQAVGRWATT